MSRFDEFEARWQAVVARPPSGRIAALVLRLGDGARATPERIELSPEYGVLGDRWAQGAGPDPESQISLMDRRVIEVIAGEAADRLQVPGDNVIVEMDLGEAALPAGTRLRLGSAVIEITAKLHTGCSKFRGSMGDEALRWINAAPHRSRRLRGVFARIVSAGSVSVGDCVSR
jgi:MOSC domain-containing protein YiiM